MKHLISFLLIFLTVFCSPVEGAKSEKPFIAVFANPGAHIWWEKYKPDLIVTASTWNDFPLFCRTVKSMSKGRKEVYIDIDCHGSPDDGMLYLSYDAFTNNYAYKASIGYLLNELAAFHIKPTKMLLECCFPETVMGSGIRNTEYLAGLIMNGDRVEDCKVKNIDYPIYGVGNTVNISNLIFLEDKFNIKPFFEDVRPFANKPLKMPNQDLDVEFRLKEVFALLYTYGQP